MNCCVNRTLHLTVALAAAALLALLLMLAAGAQPAAQADGNVIKVPDDYATIQAAIDAAMDGDTILVAAGTYAENLSVTEGITLSGGWNPTFTTQTPGDSVIDGQGLGRVISITCPSRDTVVTVDGFWVEAGTATGLGGAPAMLRAAEEILSPGTAPPPDPLTPDEHLARLRARLAGAVEQGLYPGGPRAYHATLDRVEAQIALLEGSQAPPRPTHEPSQPGGDCGGGIYSWNASLHLANSTIFDNVASLTGDGCGGGVFVGQAAPSDTLIRGNVLQENLASTTYGARGKGGGLYVYQAPGAVVEDNTFDQNAASAAGVGSAGFGGGLALEASPDAVVRGNELARNTANAGWEAMGGIGGGAYLSAVDGATVDNNDFHENLAVVHGSCGGGGLYLERSDSVLITGNEVVGNWACMFQHEGFAAGGGGIALFNNNAITVTGNLIQDNTTTASGPQITFGTSGGGLDAQKLYGARIADNAFADNMACMTGIGHGGGASLTGAYQVELAGNTFAGNVGSVSDAYGAGGGLFLLTSEGITVRHNSFQDNLAGAEHESQGGGLCAWKEGGQSFDLTVDANLFLDNQAGPDSNPMSRGGAGYVWVEDFSFTNNVVAGNAAAEGGGLEVLTGSQAEVTNNTLVSNGDIGLVVLEPTAITLTNNIVVSHTVGISVTEGATATVRYTLWGGNDTDIGGAGTISHTHPVTGDPGFVDPGNHDYHLNFGSAAVNAGDPAGVPPAPDHDADGVARPQGLAVDLGAYEWQGAWRLLPLVFKDWHPPIGWVVGDAVDDYSAIIHTTDGGRTWVRQGTAGEIPDTYLYCVAAIDAHNAWVSGRNGLILRTTDGGATWQRQPVPAEAVGFDLTGIYALDEDTAWAVGFTAMTVGYASAILHTTDGGQTWTSQGQGTLPEIPLYTVYASDADHAWVVGDTETGGTYGIVLRTTDGGATWERNPLTGQPGGDAFIMVHGVDADTVWAVGIGQAVHTADGGLNWVNQTPGTVGPAHVNGVFALDRHTIWLAVDWGGIYRSDDGGAHWQKQPTGISDEVMRVAAVNPQDAWAVTTLKSPPFHGVVLHTADGGQTWITQTTPVQTQWSWVSFVR